MAFLLQEPTVFWRSLKTVGKEMKSVSANARFHPSVQNIISSEGTEITIKISIPPEKAGLVIGKKGRTIKLLQKQSGCSMSMIQESKEATTVPKILSITGALKKIEMARQLVRDLLSCEDHRVIPRQYSSESETKQLMMQRLSVGVVKKGSERTEQVSLETGIKVHLKADGDPASSTTCAVVIGSRDRMFTVTGNIRELVFYMYVPSDKAGLIIGKKGRTIKQINDETGAYCEVCRDPNPNKKQTVFIIRGTAFQIHRAQHVMRIKIGNLPPNTPFSPFTGECAPNAPNFNTPQYNELCGASLWNNAYAQQADNGVERTNHTGQFYAGPTSNTQTTYCVVHPTANAQNTYGAVHPTANAQDTYGAVHPTANAQDTYGAVHPTANAQDTYGAVHPAADAQNIYGAVHPTANAQDTYGAVHSAAGAQNIYGAVHPTANPQDTYGAVHPAADAQNVYGAVHPTANAQDAYGAVHSAAGAQNIYGAVHPTANPQDTYGAVHPAADAQNVYGALHPTANTQDTYGAVHSAADAQNSNGAVHPTANPQDTYGAVHPAADAQNVYGALHPTANTQDTYGAVHSAADAQNSNGAVHPTANAQDTYGAVHSTAGAQNIYGAVHPAADAQNVYGAVHPAANAQDTYGAVHSATDAQNIYGAVHPTANPQNTYAAVHPTVDAQNIYGTAHPTANALNTYCAVHLTADAQNTHDAVQSFSNPQTDSAASSVQWVDYYKSMGLYDHATFVEAQMKQDAAFGAAAAGFENPLSSGAALASTLSNANNLTSVGSVGQYRSYFSPQAQVVNVARQLHSRQQQQF
ncbi:unnamed protein product [Angiostrongylus costaricensis]|uniref:KH domain-containing protein n=1 Tax=Angiostrongylus costaricensis TaxID=334426 RepID=A0A0R3PEQ3_ANGCS|nr:unnamed protein product [Angiostrongylus costaricensis]